MSNKVLQLQGCEMKGSTFQSRKFSFSGRDISGDSFNIKIKSNLRQNLKTIEGQIIGSDVIFPFSEFESLQVGNYTIEYWAVLEGIGTEIIAYENFRISDSPCNIDYSKENTFALNFVNEIIDYTMSVAVINIGTSDGGGIGKSAYQSYLDTTSDNPKKTEAEWSDLKDGIDGEDFKYSDFTPEQLALLKGADGKSAYQIALDNGFVGTEAEWLASLQGSGSGTGSPLKTVFEVDNDTDGVVMKGISDYFLNDGYLEDNITLTITNFFILDTGAISTHASWRVSQLIDVMPGETYLYFGRTNISNASAVAGYDSAGVFVTMILGKGLLGTSGLPFTIPTGVNKIRVSSFADVTLALKKTGIAYKIKDSLLPSVFSSIKPMGKSWASLGHSIWENGTLQNLVQKVFYFTSFVNYSYSANSLAGTGTNSILHPSKSDLWIAKDIFTLDTITNDFKLNRPIGTQDDFLNNTGVATYYGALRVLHEKLFGLNPKYIMICANALKRKDTIYTSWGVNANGFSLTDYSNALEWVANRLSWRFINQFRDSGISDDNVISLTSDGLHPNLEGYKMYTDLWVAEFDKIQKRTLF